MAEPLLDKEVAEYLSAQGLGGLWSDAVPIRRRLFFGEEPESPDRAITVQEDSGSAPTVTIGENRGFTVRCRGTDYATTKEESQVVHRALHFKEGILSSVKVGLIQADTNPVFLGRDPDRRYVFQQAFTAITKPITAT